MHQLINKYAHNTKEDMIIRIVGIGCALFVIIPYLANLIIAVRIKHYIKHNESAKSWSVFSDF